MAWVTWLEVAGAASPWTWRPGLSWAPPCPGSSISLLWHRHLQAAETTPRSTSHTSHAPVSLLTLRPRGRPRGNVGSWHPEQATHTSHTLCGPGSDTSSTGHGVPSPAGSSPEWAPDGIGRSTCSHTGRHPPPSTCEHVWCTTVHLALQRPRLMQFLPDTGNSGATQSAKAGCIHQDLAPTLLS